MLHIQYVLEESNSWPRSEGYQRPRSTQGEGENVGYPCDCIAYPSPSVAGGQEEKQGGKAQLAQGKIEYLERFASDLLISIEENISLLGCNGKFLPIVFFT